MGDVVVAGADAGEPDLVAYLVALREAVQADPTSAQPRGRLAMAYDANAFFGAAAKTYAQAGALDPADFAWPYLQALALANDRDYAAALAAMDRALAVDAGHAGAWLSRGDWLLDFDEHVEARVAYERAAKLAGDRTTRAAADVGLARVMLRQERPQQAVALLENLVGTFAHPYVKHLLSTAYQRAGKTAEASELRPGLEEAGQTTLDWPDEISARKSAHLRGFSGRMQIAEGLLKNGNAAEALTVLEDLRAGAPTEPRLLTALSFAYRLLGRVKDAEAVLMQAVRAHPEFPLFHFSLAVLLHERGEHHVALEHLDRAIALDPLLLDAHERRFDILLEAQRFEEALDVFDGHLHGRSDHAQTHFDAGLAAGAMTRWPRAIEHFEHALALDSEFPRAELFRARSLAEAGRFDEAQNALAAAGSVGTNPRDVAAARERLNALRDGEVQ